MLGLKLNHVSKRGHWHSGNDAFVVQIQFMPTNIPHWWPAVYVQHTHINKYLEKLMFARDHKGFH